jgi:hypothetical protein
VVVLAVNIAARTTLYIVSDLLRSEERRRVKLSLTVNLGFMEKKGSLKGLSKGNYLGGQAHAV